MTTDPDEDQPTSREEPWALLDMVLSGRASIARGET